MIDDLLEIGFPSSGDSGNVEPLLAHEAIDDRAPAQRPDNNRDGSVEHGFAEDLTGSAGDLIKVVVQIAHRAQRAGIKLTIGDDRHRVSAGN
jgi:hypothetical protein